MKKSSSVAPKMTLNVEPRTVVGKKCRQLRREGKLPANVYGPQFESQSVTVLVADFKKAYKAARETGLIYLQLGGQELPVMIKNVQRSPIGSDYIHADFRKVNLTQKIESEVPVVMVGVSEAVTQKSGVLITLTHSLLVEALPQDIPQSIEVDLSTLKEIGDQILVSSLTATTAYTIKTEPERVIVSVTAHKEESTVAETTATAAPEILTAKEAVEGEASEAPQTDKQPAPEAKAEPKS